MSLRLFAVPSLVLLSCFSFAACGSDDDEKPVTEQPEATGGRASITNFDCAANKWGNVSDACWSCLCAACKPTLDACHQDCTDLLTCAFEKHALVNKLDQIQCEIAATAGECITDEATLNAATPLVAFDTCLITATKPSGFRACEVECEIPYSGDVCTRYPPAPPAGM